MKGNYFGEKKTKDSSSGGYLLASGMLSAELDRGGLNGKRG